MVEEEETEKSEETTNEVVEEVAAPVEEESEVKADEATFGPYEKVYNYYNEVFDEVIEAFDTEALEPDMFFAEYGITSVFEEKMMHLDEHGRAAQHSMDDVLYNGLGSEADWEIWAEKVSMLGREKEEELKKAHEVMLTY